MTTPAPSHPAKPSIMPSELIAHFEKRGNTGAAWSELYDKGQDDFWDRGFPSPALVDYIPQRSARHDILDCGSHDGRRRALVPGCGRGYDPVMLALHGFDAYGLEVSSTAAKQAERYAAEQLAAPSAHNFRRGLGEEPGIGRGQVRFIEADYFARDWERHLDWEGGQFDIVYDYTFLCALPPHLRKAWATRAAELLKPGGLLICLEFPLWKGVSLPGPPWGLNGVYWNLLTEGGDGIHLTAAPPSSGGSGAFERIEYIKPERSYEQGRGTDMLSIWKKKARV